MQVGVGVGSVAHPRELGWLLIYENTEAQTAQLVVPFVSACLKVGYPKKQRPAHPYCFRLDGTGVFSGTKFVLAADVDADGAGWIEVLDGFSKHAQRRERSKTMASGGGEDDPVSPNLGGSVGSVGPAERRSIGSTEQQQEEGGGSAGEGLVRTRSATIA